MSLSNLFGELQGRVTHLKDLKAKRARGETVFTHVPTGLRKFDDLFGGLETGILTLVVGHTGDGKTALLAHLAKAAAQAGFGVLLVLLEDPAAKLADRFLAAVMGESANKLARLQFEDPARLDSALGELEWAKNIGLVHGQYTAKEVLELVDNTKTVGGAPLKLVVVDYAQSFAEDEGTMEKTCADVAWGLNVRAGERGLAAVLGSQVKSEVLQRGRSRWERTLGMGRPDERGFQPGKGDVMWSRRLEQYSKAVWYIFRPGRWRRELGDSGAKDCIFEIHVGKANYSQEGSASFLWEGKSASIYDQAA